MLQKRLETQQFDVTVEMTWQLPGTEQKKQRLTYRAFAGDEEEAFFRAQGNFAPAVDYLCEVEGIDKHYCSEHREQVLELSRKLRLSVRPVAVRFVCV